MSPTSKPSKRQKEVIDPAVAEQIERRITTWVPKQDRTRGPVSVAAADLTRQIVRDCRIGYASSVTRTLANVAGLVAYSEARGLPLDPALILTVGNIDAFTDSVPMSGNSQVTLASNLNYVRRRVLNESPPRRERTSVPAAERAHAPYTNAQIAEMYAWAARQMTRSKTGPRVRTMIAFSAGAGLKNQDYRAVTGNHITVAPDGRVTVTVPGTPDRIVPVLARYERWAAEIAPQVGDQSLMAHMGLAEQRFDNVGQVAALKAPRDVPRPAIGRLRTTWMVTLLNSGVRADIVATAAGVAVQQLARYTRFLAPVDDATVQQILRCGGAQ